jgi:hypothetical protein
MAVQVAEDPLSLSAVDLPLHLFARILSEDYGISLIWSKELDYDQVTLSVQDATVEALIGLVARRLGVDAAKRGGIWYLGRTDANDEVSAAVHVEGRKLEELRAAVQALVPQVIRREVTADGVVLLAGPGHLMTAATDAVLRLRGSQPRNALVQFYVVETYSLDSISAGIEGRPEFRLSADLASGAIGFVGGGDHSVLVDTVKSSGTVVSSALLTVIEGEEAQAQRVERVPVPQRAITESGVIQTTGYALVEVGSTFTTTAAAGRFEYRVNLGTIVGFVGEQPRESAVTFEGETRIQGDGLYLLGVMATEDNTQNAEHFLTTFKRERSRSARRVLLWALVETVEGGIISDDDAGELMEISAQDVVKKL